MLMHKEIASLSIMRRIFKILKNIMIPTVKIWILKRSRCGGRPKKYSPGPNWGRFICREKAQIKNNRVLSQILLRASLTTIALAMSKQENTSMRGRKWVMTQTSLNCKSCYINSYRASSKINYHNSRNTSIIVCQ